MNLTKLKKHLVAFGLATALGVSACALTAPAVVPQDVVKEVEAAHKKLNAPKITSAEAKWKVTNEKKHLAKIKVTVKWTKVKGAKKYHVASNVGIGKDTTSNKATYTKKVSTKYFTAEDQARQLQLVVYAIDKSGWPGEWSDPVYPSVKPW